MSSSLKTDKRRGPDSSVRKDSLLRFLAPQRLLSLPPPWRYIMAVLITAGVVALHWVLVPALGTIAHYSLDLLAPVITTVLMGIGPGILSVVLGDVAIEGLILRSFAGPLDGTVLPRLAVSMTVGLLVAGLIHALRAALLKARRSEELWRSAELEIEDLYRNAPVGLCVLDRDLRFVRINERLAEINGLPAADHIGKTVRELMPALAESVEPGMRRVLDTGRPMLDLEIVSETPAQAGVKRSWLEQWLPIRDSQGEVKGLSVTVLETTARKRAEEALRESEESLRMQRERMPIGCIVHDEHNRFAQMNPAAERIFGFTEAELKGRPFSVLVPEGGRPHVEEILRRIADGEMAAHSVNENVTKDGRVILCQWTNTPLRDPQGKYIGILSMVQDVTEQRRAEALRRALAEQERLRLGAAVEQASDSVVMIDLDGTIRYVNARFESITGTGRDQAVGRSYWDLAVRDSALAGTIRKAVAAGRGWHGPLPRDVPGGKPVDLEVTIFPAKDPSGAVIGGLVTEKDVTHELALQRQVRQAQKMEALGTLAGGITHDFNNILGAIIINTELALLDLEPDDPARKPLPTVLLAANRGKELVKQIITFSRQRTWERKPVEIAPVVREGLKLLFSGLPKNAAIHETIDAASGVVLADPSHVHQILTNLCQNAALALEGRGGDVKVKVCPVDIDADMAGRHPDLKPGPYVRLAVSDNGCGMTPEIQERIFEPFFTTRGPGGGSGLGLPVVDGIVRTYGGAITVYSEPGRGSTFNVYLPRLAGEARPPGADGPSEPEGGDERILLVEDEQAQRESLAKSLGRLGYRVTTAADGRAALSAFKRDPDAFDLVITDQIMPKMTGLELASELFCRRPGLPVILCSGFSDKVDEEKAKVVGIREFLYKPFVLREISQAIRRGLKG